MLTTLTLPQHNFTNLFELMLTIERRDVIDLLPVWLSDSPINLSFTAWSLGELTWFFCLFHLFRGCFDSNNFESCSILVNFAVTHVPIYRPTHAKKKKKLKNAPFINCSILHNYTLPILFKYLWGFGIYIF